MTKLMLSKAKMHSNIDPEGQQTTTYQNDFLRKKKLAGKNPKVSSGEKETHRSQIKKRRGGGDEKEMADTSKDKTVNHPATSSLTFSFDGNLQQSRIL